MIIIFGRDNMSERWPQKPDVLENNNWDEIKDKIDTDLWFSIVNHIAGVEWLLESHEEFMRILEGKDEKK